MQSDTKIWPRYLRWLFASFITVLAVFACLNILVDPLDVFDSPRISGFNARKPHLDHHQVLAKRYSAQRVCASAGIFGNSRAEIGFDPENAIFKEHGLVAYNHAIPGSALNTSVQQLAWLGDKGCSPKLIVLGVEFFDFLGAKKSRIIRLPSTPPRMDLQNVAELVFSLTAIRDSFRTIFLQKAEFPDIVTARGFNPLLSYIPEAKKSGYYPLFRQRAVENRNNWSKKRPSINPLAGGVSEDLGDFEQFLALAQRNGSKVHIVIYPYHAQIRLMMEKLGLSGLFNEWKGQIATTAAKYAEQGLALDITDFSALTPETLEQIPLPDDKRTELKFFWEAGHFKKSLGDLMLQQVVSGKPGFGQPVSQASLNAWLAEDRRRLEQELASGSRLVKDVDSLIKK